MICVHDVPSLQQALAKLRVHGKPIGFVPTMGALHRGHESLFERARRENDCVVVSIFVNPMQFDESKDFDAYPKGLQSDVDVCHGHGVDVLFLPKTQDLYPDGYRFKVSETELSRKFCGAHRPGHFDGVLTVVLKLLNLVTPTRAYFGEKDYQQLSLISDMVRALFLPIEIVPCATIREADGLALSSRNERLTQEQRALAPKFFQILKSAPNAAEASRQLESQGFGVDYVEDFLGRRLAAIRLGDVRLIDNVAINVAIEERKDLGQYDSRA